MVTTESPRAYETASVTCAWCGWRVQMSSDTKLEVALFLRTRLFEHIRDRHLDKLRETA